ncbi:glycosyltransferase, partial [Massilia arenosa]
RHADGLCAPTRAALACLRARIHRMPGAVIPAAYEASLDSPVPPYRGDIPAARGPALVWGGTLGPEQGIDLLLNALPRVTMFHPGLTLHLAATGIIPPELRELVRARRLDAHVSFAEHVPVPELALHLARADLAVFPRLRSRHADLYSPFVVLEALAHGVPVAASNVGGHRDLIEHGRTGILFEAGSSTALGDTLLALLSERGCLTPLGHAARSWVTMHRHWQASAACYVPVYTRLLGRRRI